MKRKFGADGGQEEGSASIFGAPPLESTMMLDTGGIKSGDNCIGNLTTIPVNASMSSGVRLFQYNRFFWNRDLFTYNLNNCAIFIALSWFNAYPEGSSSCTAFFPVFLPQTALTTFQSLQSGVTTDPRVKQRLIDDLLYYLNGMWVSSPQSEIDPYFSIPPLLGPLNFGPILFSYSVKGFFWQPNHNPDFPFFSNDNNPPPLKWVSMNSNQNIALIKNPDYWYDSNGTPLHPDKDCAFQLINPYEGWTLSEGNPGNLIAFQFPGVVQSSTVLAPWILSTYRNAGNSNHKGWCGRGAFNIGFSQNDDQNNFGAYTDIYGEYENPILQDLWKKTNLPGVGGVTPMDSATWLEFVESHYLTRYSVVAYFLPQFLPSRFVTIASDTLARNQKMKNISNSPALASPNIIGIQYLTLDEVRTWQDATLSAILPSNKAQGGIGGRTNGNDDTPVIHMDPMYSMQSVDLTITDEFFAVVQNYRTAQNGFIINFEPIYDTVTYTGLGSTVNGNIITAYVSGENSFVLDNSGGYTANLKGFPIPSWLAALNPLNSISVPPPSQQPLMGDFVSYYVSEAYMLWAQTPNQFIPGATPPNYPVEFSPSMPIGGNIIHFGRVLGY